MSGYKFVTREEIEKAEDRYFDLAKSLTGAPVAVRELKLLADQLLAERDAYREVAIKLTDYVLEVCLVQSEDDVDAEARRINKDEA